MDRQQLLDQTPAPLRLLALGADPLVDSRGQVRETHRLDLLQEMSQIEAALTNSGKEIRGWRLAPTPTALRTALSEGGRALLHLSCHGAIIDTDYGPQPVLHLEDEHGGPAKLLGNDLINLTTLADLRLILLSACRVGQNVDGGYGRLTRTLVEQGVPAAIGMQGLFPDALSDDLAAALYRGLLNGQPLGKALQAARLALQKMAAAVGLPVAYVARGGDAPLPLQVGSFQRQRLNIHQQCQLPTGVQLPDPFVGRNRDLCDLARLTQTTRVVTIVGTGGMGKTALAAAFARRFAWRYREGVLGYSFSATAVDAGAFRRELLQRLVGDELADQTREQQERRILDNLHQRDLLLLVDNYESVLQTQEHDQHPHYDEGRAVHQLLRLIAHNGGRLLLTSRQQPAGLKGERVFPGRDQPLQGINEQAAAELFYLNSPRAQENRRDPAVQRLARQVGQVTAGHPLAVALLGSEYDHGDAPPERFLDNWEAELHSARSRALDDHHATFATAFNRSFAALDVAAQQRLQALSLIPFPFFAAGAAMLWGLDEEDEAALRQTGRWLRDLVDRTLIEIDIYYQDKTPATWRFQPAVRQEVARRLTETESVRQQHNLARYAAWLSHRAYGAIHQEGNTALVNHVRPILDTLLEAGAVLPDVERLWHLRRVGWLLNAFGRTQDAYSLLTSALPQTAGQGEREERDKIRSSLLHEIANLEVTRGDLDTALSLYQQSLAFLEQIGDIKGKAASLHQMAQVYLTRGDLDTALSLYQQSLALQEQIGDIKGKAASLHNVAHVYLRQGQIDKARSLLVESLRLNHILNQPVGIAFVNLTLGHIMQTQGDLETARQHYAEALRHFDRLGMTQEVRQVERLLASLSASSANQQDVAALEALLAQLGPEERAQLEAQWQTFQAQVAAMSAEEKAQLALAQRLLQALGQARAAAEQQRWPAAIRFQQEAVAHARALVEATAARAVVEQLSILLYNLAGYYQSAGRHPEAVACLEEVVALDEQIGHEDLASDRQALMQARRLAAAQAAAAGALTPETPAALPPELEAWLAQLSPQERAALAQPGPEELEELWQAVARFAALPPQEQAAIAARAHFEQVERLILAQLSELWAAIRAGRLAPSQQAVTAGQLGRAVASLGAARYDLAALLRCALARLHGEPGPPVPAAYAGQWATWMDES